MLRLARQYESRHNRPLPLFPVHRPTGGARHADLLAGSDVFAAVLRAVSRARPRARYANRRMSPTRPVRSYDGVLLMRVEFEAAQGTVQRLSHSAARKLGVARRGSGTVSTHGPQLPFPSVGTKQPLVAWTSGRLFVMSEAAPALQIHLGRRNLGQRPGKCTTRHRALWAVMVAHLGGGR